MSLEIIANLRSKEAKNAVTAALAGFNGTQVEMREGKLSELLNFVTNDTAAPKLVLVDVDAGDQADVKALEELVGGLPAGLAVVATSKHATVDSVRMLMRTGIVDFVPQPIASSDLLNAIEIGAKKCHETAGSSQATGQVLSFIKSSGGMGATTIAVQLAHALAAGNKKTGTKNVCLLDLDIQSGAVATYLDLESQFSVLDLMGSPDRLDSSLLENVLVRHKSGLQVLAAPKELMPISAVSPEIATKLVEVAAGTFDFVVVDLPHDWNEWSTASLAISNQIVLVTDLTVSGIRRARQKLDLLKLEATGGANVTVIANRFQKPGMFANGVRAKEAERALDHGIDHFITGDSRTVESALNQGLPISESKRGARVEKDIRKFVDSIRKSTGAVEGRAEPVFAGK